MKISELMAKLKEFQDDHGDAPVKVNNDDGKTHLAHVVLFVNEGSVQNLRPVCHIQA